MEKQGSIFKENYEKYMEQIRNLDFSKIASKLRLVQQDNGLIVPFFNRNFKVDFKGIWDEEGNLPLYSECVVIAKYLLLYPDHIPSFSQWITYKDFKNAAPFAGAFTTNVEKVIAKRFSHRLDALKKAAQRLGGKKPTDIDFSYELIVQFPVLPSFDLLLVFNDADEEFPAEARVLFPDNAESLLDMECLAISGWLLSDYLYILAGGEGFTIM